MVWHFLNLILLHNDKYFYQKIEILNIKFDKIFLKPQMEINVLV